jgi:hypothetical protein
MTAGILNGSAYSLLLASFGIALLLSMRRGSGLVLCFEKLALGYVLILFHGPALELLQEVGKSLEAFLLSKGTGSVSDLDKFIGASLADAASKDRSGSAMGYLNNFLTYTAQIVRTGVWGVLASCAELLFLLARFLLEVGRDALWQILVVLFPLATAFLPIAPKLFIGMALLAVELTLWLPMLAIINIACSEVARRYMQVPADIGFYVLALEIIAVTLTFAVPVMAHKFITGSLSGSVIESWKQTAGRSGALFTGVSSLKEKLGNQMRRNR